MHRENDLKRKLRRLKRLELKLRFNGSPPSPDRLLWGRFFSDRPKEDKHCKYPFEMLLESTHSQRQAFAEFITTLYYQYYSERRMLEDVSDPMDLADLDLPPDASPQEIKSRFRALVKKHHPDLGGDHNRMIELLQKYHKLIDKEK